MADPIQQKVTEAKKTRPIFEFDIPEPLADGIKKVGLIELTADEELQATRRSRGDTHRLAYELAKQSLSEVNGEKVGLANGSVDKAWNDMSPKIRNLVLTAYAELHAPPENAAEAFLKSRKVKVT